MRYAQIREVDIANGPGIRVSLYTQGCHRHCPFCFNQETWDFNGGKAFTSELEDVLIKLINKPHIAGFTLLGGETKQSLWASLIFRGSSNQRIIDVKKTKENKQITLVEFKEI